MIGNGFGTQDQVVSDFLVGATLGDMPQNFYLPRAEIIWIRGTRLRYQGGMWAWSVSASCTARWAKGCMPSSSRRGLACCTNSMAWRWSLVVPRATNKRA